MHAAAGDGNAERAPAIALAGGGLPCLSAEATGLGFVDLEAVSELGDSTSVDSLDNL